MELVIGIVGLVITIIVARLLLPIIEDANKTTHL